jgi:hypothetical protein
MKKFQFWTSIAIIIFSCCLVLFATGTDKAASKDDSPGKSVNYNIPRK